MEKAPTGFEDESCPAYRNFPLPSTAILSALTRLKLWKGDPGEGVRTPVVELMDKPAIRAAEEFVHAGYPLDVEALLIVELDGPQAEVDQLIEQISAITRENGCVSSRISNSEDERLLFWAGRKAAFPAVGRFSGSLRSRASIRKNSP
jgi:FAD/FMN-containing dehydrogenase